MTFPRQRLAKPRPIEGVRELTRDDLATLREPRANVLITKTLRDSHHRVARLLAMGLRPGEVASRTGYSNQRISTLSKSPAFQELIAGYRKMADDAFLESQDDFYDIAFANMLKAERMLSDKLDDADAAGETLPTRDLIAISRDAADRFGYGKHTSSTNLNVDFAAKLEAAKARSARPDLKLVPAPAIARKV